MEAKAQLISVDRMYGGKYRITFETAEQIQADELKNKDIRLIAKIWREKRSLDANGYYWVLQGELAEALNVSKSFMHNKLLRRYGQIEIIENKAVYIVIPDTDQAQKKVDEDEYLHLKPTSQVKEGKDGKMYRTYMLLRGSHDYDTSEMAHLIDGLVSECKEAGIETATPEELKKMKELYGARYEQKNKSLTV